MKSAPTRTGGSGARIGTPLTFILASHRVRYAARSVESVPKMMSMTPSGLTRFARKQPSVNPVIAYGEKTGKIVSASESRNCTPEYERPNAPEMAVKTTYSAAMIAVTTTLLMNWFFTTCILSVLIKALTIFAAKGQVATVAVLDHELRVAIVCCA